MAAARSLKALLHDTGILPSLLSGLAPPGLLPPSRRFDCFRLVLVRALNPKP